MAAVVQKVGDKLFHHGSHGSRDNQQPSTHDRQDSGVDRAREEEKRALMQWEEQKRPLSPGQVHADPERKMVGHSSNVLRQEDFELVKTLGTGAHHAVSAGGSQC
jgi:protein kinase A